LRRVAVHRPGRELDRLTPSNAGELLFDNTPWAKRARQEHDAFVDALREEDVEVLEFGQLLRETLADPVPRAWVLHQSITDRSLGPAVERDWGTPEAAPIHQTSPSELRGLQFEAGSMGPKVEAACRFVEAGGQLAGIGALGDAAEILAGHAGTVVRMELSGSTYEHVLH
jgi:hypothetical protein